VDHTGTTLSGWTPLSWPGTHGGGNLPKLNQDLADNQRIAYEVSET